MPATSAFEPMFSSAGPLQVASSVEKIANANSGLYRAVRTRRLESRRCRPGGLLHKIACWSSRKWPMSTHASIHACPGGITILPHTLFRHQADLEHVRALRQIDDRGDYLELEFAMSSHEDDFLRASGKDGAEPLLQTLDCDGLLIDAD